MQEHGALSPAADNRERKALSFRIVKFKSCAKNGAARYVLEKAGVISEMMKYAAAHGTATMLELHANQPD